jgi:hypothetical protein
MNLTKKLTVPLSAELHERLLALSEEQGLSLADVVRRACESECRHRSARPTTRSRAIQSARIAVLAGMSLAVEAVAERSFESVPCPDDLLP